MKVAVFAGDLFWSSIPYDSLNVYNALSDSFDVDFLMFSKDIRLNKQFTGNEKYHFHKPHFVDCPGLKVIDTWDDLKKVSSDYDFLMSSPKIAPKNRRVLSPGDLKCLHGLWDIGGSDILTDYRADVYLVKGPSWKIWLDKMGMKNVYVAGTPHYDYYMPGFTGYGPPIGYEDFCLKYGLDVSKKKVVIAPSNPASHVQQFNKNVEILDSIISHFSKNDYEILVKTYPHDYIFHENSGKYTGIYKRTYPGALGTSQYEFLEIGFGNVKIIHSQDHHAAILYSDLLFNFLMKCSAFLSAFSVTEHVLII